MQMEGASLARGLNGRGGGGSAVSREQAAFVSLQESLSCAWLQNGLFQTHLLPGLFQILEQVCLLPALLLSVHTLSIFVLCFF